MLDDRFRPELTLMSPDDKSKRYLKFFMIDMIVNMESGNANFGFVILSDVPSKIKIKKKLRKTTHKEKLLASRMIF